VNATLLSRRLRASLYCTLQQFVILPWYIIICHMVYIWESTFKSYHLPLILLQKKAVKLFQTLLGTKTLNLVAKNRIFIVKTNLLLSKSSNLCFINNFLPLSFNKSFVLVKSGLNVATRNSNQTFHYIHHIQCNSVKPNPFWNCF